MAGDNRQMKYRYRPSREQTKGRIVRSCRLPRGFVIPLLFMLLAVGCAASAPDIVTISPSGEAPGADTPLRLHRARIAGLETLSRSELLTFAGLVEGQRYTADDLSAIRDSLKSILVERAGRPFARVERFEPVGAPGDSWFDLDIEISEGPPAIVDTVSVNGPLAGLGERVREVIATGTGDPFDPRVWDDDLERVAGLYESEGYPFVRVVTMPLFPSFAGDVVHVRAGMEVVPGRRVRIGRVEVAGLTRTRPEVVRHVLAMPLGGYFDPELARAGKRRLLRTGWFAGVDGPELFRDFEGLYGLVYTVAEQPTSLVAGAIGYAPDVGDKAVIAGSFDARFSNLLGTGRELDVSWRRDSPSLSAFRLAYGEPFLFGVSLRLDLSLAQEAVDSQYVSVDYEAGLSYAFVEIWRLGGNIEHRDVNTDSLAAGEGFGDYRLLGGELFLEADTRDDRLNPSEGGYYLVRTGRSWPLESDGGEIVARNGLDLEQIAFRRNGWVLFSAVHAQEVRWGEGTAPFAEWCRVGGAATVRGFSERSLAAERVGWLNLELRRLLGKESRVFLLADAVVLEGAGPTRWEGAYGVGVQAGAGIGILSLAAALPVGEGWTAVVIHARALARF